MPKTSSYHEVIDLVPKKDRWSERTKQKEICRQPAGCRKLDEEDENVRYRRNKILQNKITRDALIAKTIKWKIQKL